jgi:hypothetical protein
MVEFHQVYLMRERCKRWPRSHSMHSYLIRKIEIGDSLIGVISEDERVDKEQE